MSVLKSGQIGNLVQSNTVLNQAAITAPSTRTAELPFTLQDLKAAIPGYCFEPTDEATTGGAAAH